MGWTSGSTSNLVGWGGGSGGGNPGANAHGWVDEKGSGSKGTVGQVVDAVAEAAKAEGNIIIKIACEIFVLIASASSQSSDDPALPCSLFRAFATHIRNVQTWMKAQAKI